MQVLNSPFFRRWHEMSFTRFFITLRRLPQSRKVFFSAGVRRWLINVAGFALCEGNWRDARRDGSTYQRQQAYLLP